MATVAELRAKAKSLFFKGYSRMNKAELEKLISDYETSEEAFRDIDPSTHAQQTTIEQPQQAQPASDPDEWKSLIYNEYKGNPNDDTYELREKQREIANAHTKDILQNPEKLAGNVDDNITFLQRNVQAINSPDDERLYAAIVKQILTDNGSKSDNEAKNALFDLLFRYFADTRFSTTLIKAISPYDMADYVMFASEDITTSLHAKLYHMLKAMYTSIGHDYNHIREIEKGKKAITDIFREFMPESSSQEVTPEATEQQATTEQPQKATSEQPEQPKHTPSTTGSNPDDDPDPTPPSNGGKTPTQNTTEKKHPVGIVRYPDGRIKSKFDFSTCRDEKRLREMFKGASIETLEYIARSFEGFSTPKRITKAFCIDFIAGLYFPPKAKEATSTEKTKEVSSAEAPKAEHSILFTPGAIYIKGGLDDAKKAELGLVRVLKRNGDYVTVQEISYPELEPTVFRPERKKIHICNQTEMNILTESITLRELNEETGKTQKVYVNSWCEYCAESPSALKYDADYYLSVCPEGIGLQIASRIEEVTHARQQAAITAEVPNPEPVQEVKPEPEVLSCGYRVVGEYSSFSLLTLPEATTEANISSPAPVQEVTPEIVKVPQIERCPHCGSPRKPYFSYRRDNNWAMSRANFANGSEGCEWMTATLKCRDCRHKVSVYFSDKLNYPTREEALNQVVSKWLRESTRADRSTWKFNPEPAQPATVEETTPVAPQATVEQAPEPVASAPKLEGFTWSPDDVARKIKRNNKVILDQCTTHKQLKNALLTLNSTCMLRQANYMRINVHFSVMHGRTKSDDEVADEIAAIIITRRERKAKAEACKNASKPVPNQKSRRTRKRLVDTRTLSLGFDDPEPAEISSQVTTSNPQNNTRKSSADNQSYAKRSNTKRRRNSRRKYDESRQLSLGFDAEIFSGKTDQKEAA